MMFWFGILCCAAFAAIVIEQYHMEVRDYERKVREEVQVQRQYYNAVMDAAWRQQLDREQLFREYVRHDVL